ncbi:hypothetical protein [Amycolatopsis thermophila]|uniref:Histidine kinase n=1 Tax=Amycolatopsis thermophila TaxID=206084 RepID=A0ABU0EP72_9PSEU|nr:hypothetical protein [Amycolatopsis thermophila]MDQ0377088.1 hypothetical protein [Amycolatopsis thermophila]
MVTGAAARRGPWLSRTAAVGCGVAMLVSFGSRVPVWPVLVMVPFARLAVRHMDSVRPALVTFLAVAGFAVPILPAIGRCALAGWGAAAGVMRFAGVLPWWLGRYMRARRDLVEAGWQWAEELRQRIVAEEAGLRERARIAGDVHDSLSLIALPEPPRWRSRATRKSHPGAKQQPPRPTACARSSTSSAKTPPPPPPSTKS